jgi:AcrR family transcriptional regulator
MADTTQLRTRDQILATALELFSAQGYDATSLRQIADRLDMTKAALYYHFPAKEQLLLELTRPFLDGMSALVTQMRANAAHDETDVIAAYLDLMIAHIDVVALLSREPATQNHPDIGQRVRSLVAALHQLLAGVDPSPSRIVRTASAMGVVHAVPQIPVDLLDSQRGTVLAAALGALHESTAAERRVRSHG